MKKEQLSEDAYNHKLEYNKKYKKENKDKINLYAKKQSDYRLKYEKDNYKKIMIRLRKDNGDVEKLEKVLKEYNLNIREYVILKVNEDLR